MGSPIDIRMALGTDIIGMVLVIVMIIGNVWRLRLKQRESKLLIVMLVTCFMCCLADLLSFATDGMGGPYARETVFHINTALYACNFICAFSWFAFLKEHFKVELGSLQRKSIQLTAITLPAMLIANTFHPFIFDVDVQGIYIRKFGYWIYICVNYSIIINSLALYYKNYRQDGTIRFFPIWLYAIPIFVATVIQSVCYGVSIMAPSFAVAIAGAFTSLQNERVFRDQLTGLFNRPFLDYVLNLYTQRGHKATGIMISLQGFEEINEKFGHACGDQALCKTAELIHESVGQWGSVLRYAGDEFIIMVDSQIDMHISNCMEKLKMNFEKFNREGRESYKLNPVFSFKKHEQNESVDLFLDGLAAATKAAKKEV